MLLSISGMTPLLPIKRRLSVKKSVISLVSSLFYLFSIFNMAVNFSRFKKGKYPYLIVQRHVDRIWKCLLKGSC